MSVVVESTWGSIDGILKQIAGIESQSNLSPALYSESTVYTSGVETNSRTGAAISVSTAMTNETEATIDIDGTRIYIDSDILAYSEALPGGISDPWEVDADFTCSIVLTFTR